eukprot:CAMPEP_0174231792 /NCGR_PEP_ID=MMETSP0417-20130205/2243_1 /TAXON_ID=242541 /ORGANISM="Mayorella sp, Strain BSH-02190019" /LENGTH=132 /DNA_ID=CAMNT_0015309743 /DNA_START=186 /DNA_END=580 /DNA_ORIENTATION=+
MADSTWSDDLQEVKEFENALVIDHDAKVLASKNVDTSKFAAEIPNLPKLFASRDTAVRAGVDFLGEHYDVHRAYEDLIYGRRGDSATGAGVALCRVKRKSDGNFVYSIAVFKFPVISANAVPRLRDFTTEKV